MTLRAKPAGATPEASPAIALDAARDVAADVTPSYWDDACRHLARRDRVMKKLIPKFGEAGGGRRAASV
jgi:DNA-3-methyladenine glycosylase II